MFAGILLFIFFSSWIYPHIFKYILLKLWRRLISICYIYIILRLRHLRLNSCLLGNNRCRSPLSYPHRLEQGSGSFHLHLKDLQGGLYSVIEAWCKKIIFMKPNSDNSVRVCSFIS